MNDFEKGWLVGILEGEASFFKAKGYPVIQIRMTDEDTISQVAKLINANYHIEHPPSWQKKGWSPQYAIRKQGVVKLLEELLPYFSLRRQEQIKSILAVPRGIEPAISRLKV